MTESLTSASPPGSRKPRLDRLMSFLRGDAAGERRSYLVLCLLVLGLFTSLERQRNFFFLQDDNRDYFLPAFVHNVRAAGEGTIAEYNFHQSLGRMHLAAGQPATLHPLPYLAVLLSEAVLGHPYGAIEILILVSLLTGALGMMAFVRALGFPPLVALFPAVSWALLPFNIHVAQSWAVHGALIAFLPWMLHGALRLERTSRSVAELVAVQLLFFYTGYPQFFVYAALFQALFVAGRFAATRAAAPAARVVALRYFASWMGTLVLSLPLLLPMWRLMQQSAHRSAPLNPSMFAQGALRPAEYVNGVFYPFARLYEIPAYRFFLDAVPASFTHLGYAALILVGLYALVAWRTDDPVRRRTAIVAAGLSVLAILWATGALSPLLRAVPLLNRFGWPFKLHAIAAFYLLVVGAAGLDWIRRRSVTAGTGVVLAVVALQAGNLWTLDHRFPKHGFLEHADPVPLREPLADALRDGRIVTIGAERNRFRIFTAPTLGYNYATLWELQSFGGYEPLVTRSTYLATLGIGFQGALMPPPGRLPVAYLRRWGVRWYLVNRPWETVYESELLRWDLRRRFVDQHRVIFEDRAALPLAFAVAGECTPERNLRYPGDEVEVHVTCGTDSELLLSFLDRDAFLARVDGTPVPLRTTGMGQPVIPVPEGRHVVRLEYDDPQLDVGLMAAAIAVLLGGAVAIVVRRRGRAGAEGSR